jgi:hypothetical protein
MFFLSIGKQIVGSDEAAGKMVHKVEKLGMVQINISIKELW